jgi:hypothetical protein
MTTPLAEGERSFAGWRYADRLFGPTGSYLPGEDQTMDWLYKARALIGVAILVAVGVHYHHPAKSIIANFDTVLGGVTEPMELALVSVVPAIVAVVVFTRRGKRDEAFRQMLRYPVQVAVICLIAYAFILVLEHLFRMDNPLIDAAIILVGGIIYLRYILFPLRAIYLITVGMCRLGDGHPLLPPVIGTVLAWVVACQTLLTGNAGTGDPAFISLAVLLGGPMSITVLGHVEISRLRARYPAEFPFRDGPLPPQGSPAGAGPTGPFMSASRRQYPWYLALVSVIVPGIVVAAYALSHLSGPAAVDTALLGIKNGQCIQYRPDPGGPLVSLPVIPCSAMHWGQFLGLVSIGDATSSPWPGYAVADQRSEAGCSRVFSDAVGSNPRGYALWHIRPSEDGWKDNQWSYAVCIAEAGDSMPFTGSLSQRPGPASPARERVNPVPLSAVSLSGKSDYSRQSADPKAAPHTQPLTTALALPPTSCGTAAPADDWFGDSGANAQYQLTRGGTVYADVSVVVAPLTRAGEKSLPGYLKNLPSTCYSPHWFSYQNGMHYTDDSAFARPAGGTRLLDMGYGKSGSPTYMEYWTISDGYLLDFLYDPSASVSSARKPMEDALATMITHINSVLRTHFRVWRTA